jgi:TPP-dependent pyruvate/acetoin dehydrogenase alpha subunit
MQPEIMQPVIQAKHTKAGAKRVGTEAKQAEARANQAKTQKKAETVAWENPLIPNARLRQIYLAMTQARALERVLPAAKRAGAVDAKAKFSDKKSAAAKTAGSFGLEAALVGAAFDLGVCDLVSDALAGGAVELLRGATLSGILQPSTASRRRGGKAAATTAARLIAPATIAERVWAAIGAASALKAAHAQARAEDKTSAESDKQADKPARQAGVIALFTLPGEVSAALWKTALTFVAAETLPIVFVVLPAPRERGSKGRKKIIGAVSDISLASGIPAIAVDADDVIAIYRVAQESIGRARAGGGAALIECLPFALEGVKGSEVKRGTSSDAIATLERYLLQRCIATKLWIEREAKSFAKRLEKSKARAFSATV